MLACALAITEFLLGIHMLYGIRRRLVSSLTICFMLVMTPLTLWLALTNRLARAILERGKVPFYAAAWANVRSVKNGLRSGFRPAWSVITAGKKEG